MIASVADEAEREAPDGVQVERKGLSVVLHARRRPAALAWAEHWAGRKAAAAHLTTQRGRMSVEVFPPGYQDKGLVVEELAEALQAVCFIGDDVGDLPAFAALGRLRQSGKRTVSVGVASPEQPAALPASVDLMLDGPWEVLALLRRLVA